MLDVNTFDQLRIGLATADSVASGSGSLRPAPPRRRLTGVGSPLR